MIILNIQVGEHNNPIRVPKEMLTEARDYFTMIDNDLDRGFQMSHLWVEKPNTEQRCQIAADKILTALETKKHETTLLLAAYIIYKIPTIHAIHLDLSGNMNDYEIEQH